MAPMAVPRLRVAKVIDSSWKTYRQNWKYLVAVVGIVMLPLMVLQHVLLFWIGGHDASTALDPDSVQVFSELSIVYLVIGFFAAPFIAAPAVWATGELLDGRKPTYKQALAIARKRYWALMGVALLVGLLWIGAVFAPGAILAGLIAGESALAIFASAVYAVIVVWLGVRISLFFPGSVVDGLGPWTAVKRSFQLTRGYVWRIILVGCIAGIFAWLLQFTVMLAITLVFGGMMAAGLDNLEFVATGASLITNLFALLYIPFFHVLFSVLYIELRARHELRLSHQEVASH